MMLSEETSAVRPQKQTRFNGAKLVWMLKGSPLTVTGAVIIVLMLLMMIFSPWLATHDPNAIDLTARLLPPSAANCFLPGRKRVSRDPQWILLFRRHWSWERRRLDRRNWACSAHRICIQCLCGLG